MTSEDVSLRPACDADAEDLASLRVAAMRESLEKVGRFDPVRARTRFLSSFSAQGEWDNYYVCHVASGA